MSSFRAWPILLACGYALLHFILNGALGGYGIFRDELYYLVNAERLAWGYVDHPPLAPLVLAAVRTVLGESLWALRLLPALAAGATLLLTDGIVRRLGGGSLAGAIALLGVAIAPVVQVMFGFYSMNSFEILLWTAAALVALQALEENQPRQWLLLGLLMGIGLQNKHTFVLFAAGLALGLLLHRRALLRQRAPWLAAALTLVIFLPNLLWQATHDWATLEFYAGAAGKNIATAAPAVLIDQVVSMHPFTLPVWLLGLVLLGRNHSHRPLVWTYLLPLLLLMAAGSSRPDRLAPAYPLLMAAGGVAIERFAWRTNARWIPITAIAALVAGGIAFAPLGLPVLPPEQLARFAATVGIVDEYEAGKTAALPQYFADRFGWQELAETVDGVSRGLSAADRAEAAVFTGNYGEAGAVEVFGATDLPVISGHNQYYLWGPGNVSGRVVIALGVARSDLEQVFGSVEEAARFTCTYCMDYENNLPIYVARDLVRPLPEIWPLIKHYD